MKGEVGEGGGDEGRGGGRGRGGGGEKGEGEGEEERSERGNRGGGGRRYAHCYSSCHTMRLMSSILKEVISQYPQEMVGRP